MFQDFLLSNQPLSAVPVIADLVSRIDWVGMAAGWAFVVIVVFLASEYRRRYIIT